MSNASLICKSQYIGMRDGVRLAMSVWMDGPERSGMRPQPAVLIATRYWRAIASRPESSDRQLNYELACFLSARGYVLAVVDVRGTGASFGTREEELPANEIDDLAEVIKWISGQPWCDGRVVMTGTSYTANTALHGLINAPDALKLAVCRAPDFDLNRHLFSPGGITNSWFIEEWGEVIAALDRNDVRALEENCPWAADRYCGFDRLLGVRPVDEDQDGTMLARAVAEHESNFNLSSLLDDPASSRAVEPGGGRHFHSSLFEHRADIEASGVPMVVRCGWHDAATALGALSMFATFDAPMHVVIGPWSHSGNFRADPLQPGDGTRPESIPKEQEFELIASSIEEYLEERPHEAGDVAKHGTRKIVDYYTLGENRWKRSHEWPLPQTRMRRLYFSEGRRLSYSAPDSEVGSDIYEVKATTGTGRNNRWHTQMGHPVFFHDRREEDEELLVYDTEPLEHDVEITGHPTVRLFVRSTASDGQFHAYLEAVGPDGCVRLLTEGQLGAIHRRVTDKVPPYRMFGPYHSLAPEDAEPLIPGEVAEIAFDLYPISVLLRRGQCIRIAIACADKDVFAAVDDECPIITVERNRSCASAVDLPIVENG